MRYVRYIVGFAFIFMAGFGYGAINAYADCVVSSTSNLVTESAVFAGGRWAVANSFVPSCTGTVSSISAAYKVGVGSPSATTMTIYTDNAGQPSATALGNGSNSVNPGSCTVETFAVGTPFTVTSGTTYWAVMSNPSNVTNYIQACGDTSVSGKEDLTGTPTWTASGMLLNFGMTVVTGGGGGGGGYIPASTTFMTVPGDGFHFGLSAIEFYGSVLMVATFAYLFIRLVGAMLGR